MSEPESSPPLFSHGQLVATPGALALLEAHSITPASLLARHLSGDWGELTADDLEANRIALQQQDRLLSAYTIASTHRVWIVTEANRSSTTILLPEEY